MTDTNTPKDAPDSADVAYATQVLRECGVSGDDVLSAARGALHLALSDPISGVPIHEGMPCHLVNPPRPMADEPCTEINCSVQTHPASEGHIDGPSEPERLRAEVERLTAALATMDHFAEVAETCERKANESHARRESAEAALSRGVMILDRLIESVESDDSGDPAICHDYDRIDAGECALLADLRRLRAALDDASPASIPVSSPRTLPQVLGMTADDEAAMQASLSESFAAIRAAERRAATSPAVVLGAANDDCPHAAPFRYCDGCAVSPCPIGLD